MSVPFNSQKLEDQSIGQMGPFRDSKAPEAPPLLIAFAVQKALSGPVRYLQLMDQGLAGFPGGHGNEAPCVDTLLAEDLPGNLQG
jgi:hypothetical protein